MTTTRLAIHFTVYTCVHLGLTIAVGTQLTTSALVESMICAAIYITLLLIVGTITTTMLRLLLLFVAFSLIAALREEFVLWAIFISTAFLGLIGIHILDAIKNLKP
ncbi:MAG TPA: hypothetical protein VEH27_00840 [Methylomirabilota bacterium]|nr:hypothetical protein [Methylomirabilota bacterium]